MELEDYKDNYNKGYFEEPLYNPMYLVKHKNEEIREVTKEEFEKFGEINAMCNKSATFYQDRHGLLIKID